MTLGVGDTIGGIQHLGAELLKSSIQCDFLIVPYGSLSKLAVAVRTGEVDAAFELMPGIVPQVQQGVFRALATTGSRRFADFPNVPTIAEAGFPKAELTTFTLLAAPAGTPAAAISRLNNAMAQVLAQTDFQKALRLRGAKAAVAMSPAQTQRMMDADIEKWRSIVRLANVSL